MRAAQDLNKVFEFTWRILVFVVAIAIIVIVSTNWTRWEGGEGWQRTNDAYLKSDLTPISAKVAGYICELPIRDYERVRTGQVLARRWTMTIGRPSRRLRGTSWLPPHKQALLRPSMSCSSPMSRPPAQLWPRPLPSASRIGASYPPSSRSRLLVAAARAAASLRSGCGWKPS